MNNIRRNLSFTLFLIAGIIIGSLLGSICQGIPYLSWLAYEKTLGIPVKNPFFLDLIAFRFSIGAEVSVTIAQIFTIILSLFAYNSVGKKL